MKASLSLKIKLKQTAPFLEKRIYIHQEGQNLIRLRKSGHISVKVDHQGSLQRIVTQSSFLCFQILFIFYVSKNRFETQFRLIELLLKLFLFVFGELGILNVLLTQETISNLTLASCSKSERYFSTDLT